MSKYRRDDTPPETLGQMLGLMSKPGPPIADPTTVAMALLWKIYVEMKSKVLLGDKQVESVTEAVKFARDRTEKEVVHRKLRKAALANYDAMLVRLVAGGEIQL